MKKILRVNLETKEYQMEEISGSYANLGGRGLSSQIISEEVPPIADPLGKDNKLIFAAGILAGTTVPNSGRISIGAKSPLTNTITEANAGGSAAQMMARLGIQAIVMEGCAQDITSIKVDKSGVEFMSASDLKGMGNYKLIDALKDKYGDEISIISIGQAGEMQLRASAVSVTGPDFCVRIAGRGGMGAVMGSKNLKAIIIDDDGADAVEVQDKDKLKEATRALAKGISANPLTEGLKALGTPLLVNIIGDGLGTLATKNFSMGKFEGAGKISGESLAELINKRPNGKTSHKCMSGCIMSCSNVLTDEKGEEIVTGLEFETLALMGSNCMIDDLDIIGKMNAVCNDAGLDTIDVGGAIGVAMESGMLAWGDGESALKLVKEIGEGTEKGKMIGNGCKYTGEKLGVERIPVVKGQCISGYDPRGLKGTGTTYATATMGADHTCGNALPSPTNPDYDHTASTGQAPVSKFLQTYFAAIDSLGICLFASLPALDDPGLMTHMVAGVSAVQGRELNDDYLVQLGGSVVNVERKFNEAAGFGNEDDRLPEFFTKEPLPPYNGIFDVSEEELDSVYA